MVKQYYLLEGVTDCVLTGCQKHGAECVPFLITEQFLSKRLLSQNIRTRLQWRAFNVNTVLHSKWSLPQYSSLATPLLSKMSWFGWYTKWPLCHYHKSWSLQEDVHSLRRLMYTQAGPYPLACPESSQTYSARAKAIWRWWKTGWNASNPK